MGRDVIKSDILYFSIIDEVKKYTESFIDRFKNKKIDRNVYGDILLLCSEMLDSSILELYNDDLKGIISNILDDIKSSNKSYRIFDNLGMFGGIGQLAFSVNIISYKTGDLLKFSHSLNQSLLDLWHYVITNWKKVPISFGVYDVISGLSGGIYYLLNCVDICNNEENRKKLHNLISFLIKFTDDYRYKGADIVKFHIKQEQQYLDEEKRLMPHGHINFGMAHGIIGPLIALSKADSKHYYMTGLNEAILKLIDLYEKFVVNENGILKYPRRLPFESYVAKQSCDLTLNSGWCYGNISIVRGLMKSYKYLKNYKKYEYYKQKLLKIINQSIKLYNLSSPIVCHGYGSVVAIQLSTYKDTKDNRFLETLERNVSVLLTEHNRESYYRKAYREDLLLLSGSGGVILTLLDSITLNLEYCRVLLMD